MISHAKLKILIYLFINYLRIKLINSKVNLSIPLNLNHSCHVCLDKKSRTTSPTKATNLENDV